MKYPSLVYKDGGTHARPNGSYSYRKIESDADLNAALSLGWFKSLAEAIEPKPPKTSKPKKITIKTDEEAE